MANLRPFATLLLVLNFFMYAIVVVIGGWAINKAIDQGFIIGQELVLPAHFTPIFFPIGNAATGFFVVLAVVAAAVGAASAVAGVSHVRLWNCDSMHSAASSAVVAWALTLLAMGLACKEADLDGRNARLRTTEAFLIILSATQFLYILVIHGVPPTLIRMN